MPRETLKDRQRKLAENLAKTRHDAFDAYSRSADLVRERLMNFEAAIRDEQALGRGERERRDAALQVAIHNREMAEKELGHADQVWREFIEDHRWRQQDAVIRSAKRSSWFAAVAAAASAIAALVASAPQVARWLRLG